MITEIASITIDPKQSAAFEAAVAAAAPSFHGAKGCHGLVLERIIEDPARYRLLVRWDSVEAHMVDFRTSPAFQTWRSLAGPFFTAPPHVEHSQMVAMHF